MRSVIKTYIPFLNSRPYCSFYIYGRPSSSKRIRTLREGSCGIQFRFQTILIILFSCLMRVPTNTSFLLSIQLTISFRTLSKIYLAYPGLPPLRARQNGSLVWQLEVCRLLLLSKIVSLGNFRNGYVKCIKVCKNRSIQITVWIAKMLLSLITNFTV